ncbi:DUF1801 domain-containing protein [Pelagibacterium lacus]|uniref:DUF1801 domain-containing protein n=2 Tax=Pelagibacterium lacus TaxID=2282655 RepID=A0A369W610_9HYPH|nr:DUF1801 domain-containing protein [Pelagibacterium lacus]
MIAGLEDWRGPLLARVRQGFLAADDAMIEEWKWMGSPTWSCDGLVAVANPHKQKIKITFAHGAALPDPASLFNGKDTGATRRSIDLFAPEDLDEAALIALIRAAIAYNRTHLKKNAGMKNR